MSIWSQYLQLSFVCCSTIVHFLSKDWAGGNHSMGSLLEQNKVTVFSLSVKSIHRWVCKRLETVFNSPESGFPLVSDSFLPCDHSRTFCFWVTATMPQQKVFLRVVMAMKTWLSYWLNCLEEVTWPPAGQVCFKQVCGTMNVRGGSYLPENHVRMRHPVFMTHLVSGSYIARQALSLLLLTTWLHFTSGRKWGQ